MSQKTKLYTFYSYKGGSGRSTTTMNTVLHLIDALGADSKHPILLVDADLESSGLTFFFRQENRFLGGKELTCFSAFDTNYIFSDVSEPKDYFEESTTLAGIPLAFDQALSKHFPNATELFSDVKLPDPMWGMLAYIAQKYDDYKDVTKKASDTTILDVFDFSKFIDSLNRCHKSEHSKEEKLAQKCKLIRDFLPTTEYTDISSYFGKPEGTVRFLGVDTRQNDERVARGVAAKAINKLRKECTKRNFKAIVFDSGAGTQSSAHIFQQMSDVIVCCMRPTLQFAKGTKTAIRLYKRSYGESTRVFLLPTAVPKNDSMDALRQNCFDEIKKIVDEAPSKIDDSFCSLETALCEVGLFKWREQILGVQNFESVSKDIENIIEPYTDVKTMPEDAKSAYEVYGKLAQKIAECSKE